MYPSSWLLAVAELLAFVVSSMVEECIENCEPMQAGEMAQMTGLGGWWFEVPVRGKLSLFFLYLLHPVYLQIFSILHQKFVSNPFTSSYLSFQASNPSLRKPDDLSPFLILRNMLISSLEYFLLPCMRNELSVSLRSPPS